MALTAQFPDIAAGLGVNGFVGGARARAADMNTYVVEPLLYLKPRTILRIVDVDGTVATMTSTSFADVTGISGSITTLASSRLRFEATIFGATSGVTNVAFTVNIDTVDEGHASNGLLYQNSPPANVTYSFQWVTSAAVSDAAHTVKLRCKVGAGTFNVYGVAMNVYEVK